MLLHAPWLRLLPREGLVAEGSMVVLATVVCADAAGLVTNLMHEGCGPVGLAAQQLKLWASDPKSGELVGSDLRWSSGWRPTVDSW